MVFYSEGAGITRRYAFLLRTALHNQVERYSVFLQLGDDNFGMFEMMIWAKNGNIHVMMC